MDSQSTKYKTRKVTIPKGKKESTLAKMEADGWELTEQLDGTSRSMLTFRKPAKSHTMMLAVISAVSVIALVAGIALYALPRYTAETTAGTSAETTAEATAETETSAVPSPAGTSDPDYLSPTGSPRESDAETTQSPTPSATDEASEKDPASMTAKNSPEFAQILAGPEYCSGSIDDFAKAYAGETIEFDGHIATIRPSAVHKGALDTLMRSGDYGYKKGPVFKFAEGSPGLNPMTGMNNPSIPIVEGQNLHIIAKIESYDLNSCLFYVEPIETTLR